MAGLRERKKAETREAISLAAVRLTAERGLDSVTVDDIAEAARVARRTFRNYFPNKESAILDAVEVFVAHYVEFLDARDVAEPLLTSLAEAAVALVESPHAVDRVLTVRRLARQYPALRVRCSGTHGELSLSPLTGAIAGRTGTDPDVDVYPRVVAHAAWGVLVSAIDMHSGADDDSARLIARVRVGFAALAGGFSKPVLG